MALVLKDRVRETSISTGTGTIDVLGAVTGYQTFGSAIGSGNTCYYTIYNQGTNEWEVGLGTVGSGTLARNTVLSSSNAGSLVSFSAGTKDVFVTYPAEKAVYEDAAGNIDGYPITGGSINGTTIGASTPAAGTFTSLTDSGNLTFTGTANRITGDFSNATVANRVMFQSSTTNGNTIIYAIPNGTGAISNYSVANNSDVANASIGNITVNSSEVQLTSTRLGSGTFLPLTMYTGGSERMRIDTSGNVGIGTSSPSARLTVDGAVRIFGTTTSGYRLYVNPNTLVTDVYAAGTDTVINTVSNGTLNFGTNNTERMRIDSSGNVGIGTNSPAGKFAVSTGDNNKQFVVDLSADPVVKIGLPAWYNIGALAFINGTAGERMRIDSSGNLLVNTTDTSLFDNTSGYGVCYRFNASLDVLTTGDNCSILNRAGTDGSIQEFRKSSVIVGSVSVTGSATSYNTSSDYRLKENIAPMTGALETVAQLKPVTYNWKVDGSDGQGFIAHELQAVVPDAVTGEKDAVDKDGKPVYQGVDTSFLVATLTAAIQELSAKVDTLQAELNTLKGN